MSVDDHPRPDPRPDPPLKPHWRAIAALIDDRRDPERIAVHYRHERALASELKAAGRAERSALYGRLYDRLFAAIPDHPQTTRGGGPNADIARQVILLEGLVPRGSRFLEIGAGDARVALGLCGHCAEAVAVDVSEAVLAPGPKPANFRFVLIDGLTLPLEDGSIDFVYSNQLMEHLHPDDAREQLAEIARVLAPGGRYLCVTPSRLSGPHDISMYFEDRPTGFHIKEYTYAELADLFGAAGLRESSVVLSKGHRTVALPLWVGRVLEEVVGRLAATASRPALSTKLRNLLGIRLLGRKS